MADVSGSEDFVPEKGERQISVGRIVRVVLWLLLVAAVVVFAVLNTDKVRVDWLFGDADVWLWLIVAGSAAAGFLVGAFTVWRRS
jgi:uncharacterized integral membrane protein